VDLIRYQINFNRKGHLLEKIDENTVINYVRMKSPNFLISARDVVLGFRIFKNPDGSTMVIAKSVPYAKMPP
jgi:hypothetical protein